jgi:hypothetical protein
MPRGAKIAAQQTVLVSDRRSREPNDLDQAKPYRYWLNADGWALIAKFSMICCRSHPWALLYVSAVTQCSHARTSSPAPDMSFATLCLTQVHVFSTGLGQLTQASAEFFVFAQPFSISMDFCAVLTVNNFGCRSHRKSHGEKWRLNSGAGN